MKNIFCLFLLFASSAFIMSQENEDSNFWEDWIDDAIEKSGRNVSVLQAEYENPVKLDNSDYAYMLARTIVSHNLWNAISLTGLTARINHRIYITNNNLIGKNELIIHLRSVNASETELVILKDVIQKMNSVANQIGTGELIERWYGHTVKGQFIWKLNGKNILVTITPHANFLAWTDSSLYITVIQQ